MRQIKFRGKDLETCDWVYGDLEIHRKDSRRLIHSYNAAGDYNRQYDVDEDTIGQFTGLHDKNGKDIYEGDIICFVDGQKRVNGEWVDNVHFYNVEYSKGAFSGVLGLAESMDAVQVIGNIIDNPELLKQ